MTWPYENFSKLIDRIRIILLNYPKRKKPLKTVTEQQNKQRIWRRKGVPKVPPLKELLAFHIGYLIIISVRRMKSITCSHL